ncbi:nuclear transport factor 2 family protein [Dermacoccus abyssi]|uniref:Nuclear transport factor 2 family protein n=1 Tax=Dermacoccus abyssi TaxID=322596 RepID=A0ABX5Z5R5_9MICO|nr:nuclear transport factor 2 family protein [Dermacoccus abyssi]
MSNLSEQRLVTLEHYGWQALCSRTGADFYGRLMTDDGVMLLAGGLALDRGGVVESLDGAPPWSTYELSNVKLLPLGTSAAALTYRATARRGDDEPFTALMTSVYRLVDDEPRLALYQQTVAPLHS